MPEDKPIAFTAEGRPIFDNTPTVVSVIIQNTQGQVLAVRRANNPGQGLLGLPGGYHMRGESWQEAGCREVLEEAGLILDPERIHLSRMDTDEYGNNLVICRYTKRQHFEDARPVDGEALEVLWLGKSAAAVEDWAFPRHKNAVMAYFEEMHR